MAGMVLRYGNSIKLIQGSGQVLVNIRLRLFVRLRGGRQGVAAPLRFWVAAARYPERCSRIDACRLRGGRQGAAAPPAPPARDFVPSIPDLMHVQNVS